MRHEDFDENGATQRFLLHLSRIQFGWYIKIFKNWSLEKIYFQNNFQLLVRGVFLTK